MITLKTLPLATAQEVFDQVVNHLREQGCKSMDETGNKCWYSGTGNTKCAAGCLISDTEYDQRFEGYSWGTVSRIAGVNNHKDLITRLQSIHDDHEVHSWELWFCEAAREYGLQYTPKSE